MRLPRWRAVMKWWGLALSALLFLAWFSSRWVFPYLVHIGTSKGDVIALANGRLLAGHGDDDSTPPRRFAAGWHIGMETGFDSLVCWRWLPERAVFFRDSSTITAIDIYIPLYIPFTLLALPTAYLFHRDRRRVRWSREGRCVGCGYDLSGVSGKCPECGREAA